MFLAKKCGSNQFHCSGGLGYELIRVNPIYWDGGKTNGRKISKCPRQKSQNLCFGVYSFLSEFVGYRLYLSEMLKIKKLAAQCQGDGSQATFNNLQIAQRMSQPYRGMTGGNVVLKADFQELFNVQAA
jgi:hypothetical protein